MGGNFSYSICQIKTAKKTAISTYFHRLEQRIRGQQLGGGGDRLPALIAAVVLVHSPDCYPTLRFSCKDPISHCSVFLPGSKCVQFQGSHFYVGWIWIWTQRLDAFEFGSLALPNSWFFYTSSDGGNKYGRMNPSARV